MNIVMEKISIHCNIISLSSHEQVCLMKLRLEIFDAPVFEWSVINLRFLLQRQWKMYEVFYRLYKVRCTVWYHLCNLKNVKNTHRGVLILVKLQLQVIFHVFYIVQLVPNGAPHLIWNFLADIHLFKVNNGNIRIICEIWYFPC